MKYLTLKIFISVACIGGAAFTFINCRDSKLPGSITATKVEPTMDVSLECVTSSANGGATVTLVPPRNIFMTGNLTCAVTTCSAYPDGSELCEGSAQPTHYLNANSNFIKPVETTVLCPAHTSSSPRSIQQTVLCTSFCDSCDGQITTVIDKIGPKCGCR